MTYDEMARWARWWARRYSWAVKRGYAEFDDLVQSALVGILDARRGYADDGNWATWSSYFIRKEIRRAIGIRHGQLPPFVQSLNIAIGEDGEDQLIDMLPDEDAPDAQEIAEYNDLQQQVRAAVQRLKDDRQREIVVRTCLNGEPQRALADDFGVSIARIQAIWTKARQNLARDKVLRALADIELRTKYLSHTSIATFNATNTSDVERAVMWRERERARLAQIIKDCNMRDTELQAMK